MSRREGRGDAHRGGWLVNGVNVGHVGYRADVLMLLAHRPRQVEVAPWIW